MAGITWVLKELLRYPMVALFTWRVEILSSGHSAFIVVVAPVQPSMSESGNSSKVFWGPPLKLLIVKVGFAELSETFMPVIERKY
jgi:hypothetical protein